MTRAATYGIAGFLLGVLIAVAWNDTVSGLILMLVLVGALKLGRHFGHAAGLVDAFKPQRDGMKLRGPQ